MRRCRLAARSIGSLSGGERARVFVARALATEAPILCLDEPTASLDISHAFACLQLCRELAANGQAIVIVLHRLDEIERWADEVYVMHQGSVVSTGAPVDALDTSTLAQVWVQRRAAQADAFFLLIMGKNNESELGQHRRIRRRVCLGWHVHLANTLEPCDHGSIVRNFRSRFRSCCYRCERWCDACRKLPTNCEYVVDCRCGLTASRCDRSRGYGHRVTSS